MPKRRFNVMFSIYDMEIDAAIIELDQAVIDAVDDNWREHLYPLHTPEEIAEHVAGNMIVNNLKLSQLDGWADQPDGNAKIISWPNLDNFTIEATEIDTPAF